MNLVRIYHKTDKEKLFNLYKNVAKDIGGVARTFDEINKTYINTIIKYSSKSGIHLVVNHPTNENQLIGEIHCYKLQPNVFNHVLSELTVVVAKQFQGKGIGKQLFNTLLKKIETERKDILRVELIVRESNIKAIDFYKQFGFKIEGKLENRINSGNGTFEADIPMAWINKYYNS